MPLKFQVEHSLTTMGVSISMACLSSAGSAAVLLFCHTAIFMQFGTFLLLVNLISFVAVQYLQPWSPQQFICRP